MHCPCCNGRVITAGSRWGLLHPSYYHNLYYCQVCGRDLIMKVFKLIETPRKTARHKYDIYGFLNCLIREAS